MRLEISRDQWLLVLSVNNLLALLANRGSRRALIKQFPDFPFVVAVRLEEDLDHYRTIGHQPGRMQDDTEREIARLRGLLGLTDA